MPRRYRLEHNLEGDDPYGPIHIKRGGTTVAKFPLDDAPVRDFNQAQRSRATLVMDFLNSYTWSDEHAA